MKKRIVEYIFSIAILVLPVLFFGCNITNQSSASNDSARGSYHVHIHYFEPPSEITGRRDKGVEFYIINAQEPFEAEDMAIRRFQMTYPDYQITGVRLF